MKLYFWITLLLLALILPVSAGTAQQAWYNDTEGGGCVTAVDTNSAGTLIIAGYWNGNITAYNIVVNTSDNTATGTVAWSNRTNNSAASTTRNAIKKIVADDNGNIAWINEKNQTGYISAAGAVGSKVTLNQNLSDIALRADAGAYAVTMLRSGTTPSQVILYDTSGGIIARNTSFGTNANWTQVGYDPSNQWIVTANSSSPRLYYWNITGWAGWDTFNPTHTFSKNASQQWIDNFAFNARLDVADPASGEASLTFINTSSVSYVTQINNSHFYYNALNTGRYFFWTANDFPNMSNPIVNQSSYLNLSAIGSDGNYHVVVKRGLGGIFVIYFGNTTYSYNLGTYVPNNTLYHVNYTATGTWQAPTGVTSANVTLVGGGGGGQYGTVAGAGGTGGSAGNFTMWNLIAVTPGSDYAISIGAGAGSGGKGSNTSFNVIYNTTGGNAGTGLLFTNGTNGTQNISTSYPSGSNGGTSYYTGCGDGDPYVYTAGKYGGLGYGGGGGGGAGTATICNAAAGAGGTGASGVARISYLTHEYYSATATLYAINSRNTGMALNPSSTKDLVGNIMALSVPSNGGLASISTDTIFYQQYLDSSGIGVTYCATMPSGGYALYAGIVHDNKASNSGTASIEARGSYGLIYDAGGVARASSLTGNTIRSVDTAMSSGLFGAFGGDEGKLYMLSKESSPNWYSYYTGGIASPIRGVAVAWNGESVTVGRDDGRLEYYISNVSISPVPTPSYVDVQLRVYKDSSAYPSQTVTIYTSAGSSPFVWSPAGISYTDGAGKMNYLTSTGTYYKFVVNNVPGTTSGEGEVIWQSNTQTVFPQIFIVSAQLPYEWSASYVTATNNVSVVYSDTVTPTSILVTITDLKTNQNVLTHTYTGVSAFNLEYHDQLGNGTYQVQIQSNRQGSMIKDQRMVSGSGIYSIPLPMEDWLKYSLAVLFLMILAGIFSYSNARKGAFAIVIVAVVFFIFGWLPVNMVSALMIAALFAVASLFGSRVQ
jgi:hypothetical protein